MQMGWEQLFWLMFERTSDPVALLDTAQRAVAVNRAAAELVGRGRSELIGKPLADVIAPAHRANTAQEWQAFLRSGEQSGTRALRRSDGALIDVSFAARFADIGGRRLAVYVFLPQDAEREAREVRGTGARRGAPLTPRERQIVTLTALGHETDAIAAELGISSATTRAHARNAMSKLDVRTRAQLVAAVLATQDATDSAALDGMADRSALP